MSPRLSYIGYGIDVRQVNLPGGLDKVINTSQPKMKTDIWSFLLCVVIPPLPENCNKTSEGQLESRCPIRL
ncbi:hypothetical protein ANN_17688 [Periplaneta americana]|uniref:Uncharacterized protein n=1 Tax=Periplaneta americana TaxID=6978 RepID=A0ABQ8SU77_PERAM|nr:hypothetical protein ANN_17688 [Periplaneta americana]